MMTALTPLHIKILLHAYSCPTPYPYKGGCTEEYQQNLVSAGLVHRSDAGGYYECTEKGKAHVNQLCALPFPKPGWISATGEIINE